MPDPKAAVLDEETPVKKPTRTVPEKKKTKYVERPVKFPFYKVLVCCHDREDHFEYIENPFAPENANRQKELAEDPNNRKKPDEYSGPITEAVAKELLGWETEPDYVKRKLSENPDYKESKLKFGGEFLLKDADGNKVKCWNNETKGYMNRPFDEKHSRSLAQDILTKNWHVNEENVIISRTGLVISGQHRLIALVLACEEWRKQYHWQEIWKEEPVMETLIAFGCDEKAEVIRTIDNVKPRSLSDVFYTSPLFADKNQHDRKEMTRMLSYAVDLLWQRTRGDGDKYVEHQTHSASIDFLERHPKLLACVKHIYDEDGGKPVDLTQSEADKEELAGKAISVGLRFQRGHAAALMYLMGQCKTKEDTAEEYYLPNSSKNEKKLDWSMWDKAMQFWTELAENKLGWTAVVKDSLAELNDPDRGFTAGVRDKQAVIVKAWSKWRLKEPFDGEKPESLHPEFSVNETTNRRFIKPVDEPVIGGIDRGTLDEEPVDDKATTKEEVDEAKDKARADKIKKAIKNNKPEVRADSTKKVTPSTKKTGKKAAPKEEEELEDEEELMEEDEEGEEQDEESL